MSHEKNTGWKPVPQVRVRAYTLAEVLIVMAIFAILLALGVPAFNSAIKNSDEVSAENQLRIGLAIARDAAVQSSGAEDTAAVFFFTPGGRTSIVPYIKVGTLKQPRSFGAEDMQLAAQRGQRVEDRDVFAPISGSKTVQLPRGWMVRAYAPPGSLDKGAQTYSPGWYQDIPERLYYLPETNGNWVFPETGFYPSVQTIPQVPPVQDRAQSGLLRSSFMVRFRAGTGAIAVADQRLTIVIDPSPDTDFREQLPPFNLRRGTVYAHRIDQAEDVAEFVRRRLKGDIDAAPGLNLSDLVTRAQLFGFSPEDGFASSDSVMCRPIAQLALYREADLAQYLGARGVNRVTGCLYGDPAVREVPLKPSIDTSLFSTAPDLVRLNERINAWIEGRRLAYDQGTNAPETTSKIFTFGTYLGQTLEFDDADGGGEN
jgi:prepilin-type N-terminal cleavage/methylation domain-containing protein